MKEILQKKNLNSAKHKRGGNKKSKKCEECDLEFFSHWNLKHHKLVTHSTKEEREKISQQHKELEKKTREKKEEIKKGLKQPEKKEEKKTS